MLQKLFSSPLTKTRIRSDKVGMTERLAGYFIGPFIALISNAIFGSYLNRYYTDVLGLTRWAGAFAMLMPVVSVLFVVAGNLLVGRWIDSTRTGQGKARPYLFLSAPFVIVAMLALFSAPRTEGPAALVWIAVSYNLYYSFAYPMYYTSHSSMVALSTRDTKERGLLATFSNASGVMAVGVGASILFPLFQGFLFVTKNGAVDPDASYVSWRLFISALAVVTLVGIWIEYFFTRERITEETAHMEQSRPAISMKEQFKAVAKEKYWWLIILYFLLFQFGGLVKNGSMTYYCRWMFGAASEVQAGQYQSLLGMVGGLPTAVGMVVAWPIAKRFGKQRSVAVGMIISVLGGLVSFIDVHSFPIVCAGVVLKGIGSIPGMYVTLAILSDVLDHMEAKNGFRSDGLTMAVYGAIMVGMAGLGNGLINVFLSAGSYNAASPVQTGATQTALVICYLAVELICYGIIAVMMLFLNVEQHIEEDQAIIARRHRAQASEGKSEMIPEEGQGRQRADAAPGRDT